jgi:hypothetical protein
MTRRSKALLSIALLFLVAVVALVVKMRQKHSRAALVRESSALLGVLREWRVNGKPEGEAADDLLNTLGTTRLFVFTNVVTIDGSELHPVFGSTNGWFGEGRILVVAEDERLALVGPSGTGQLVPLGTRVGP